MVRENGTVSRRSVGQAANGVAPVLATLLTVARLSNR